MGKYTKPDIIGEDIKCKSNANHDSHVKFEISLVNIF